MELRDWQKEAVEYFFKHEMNALFSVPTGAGKTFVAIYILKKYLEVHPRSKILIVVPKNVILQMWVEELDKNGFLWNRVGIFNGSFKEYSQITITTTKSVHKINQKIFDFLIADEVHNMGTTKLLTVLDSKHFSRKLGLSATPDRSDFKHWKIYEAFDMNVFEYSIKRALEEEVLNKFEFYDIVYELDGDEKEKYDEITMSMGSLMKSIGGYNRFVRLPATDKKKLALLKLIGQRKDLVWNHNEKIRIVSSICKGFPNSKIIVFSQYNSMTNKLYYYLGSENLKSKVIYSTLSDKQKIKTLEDFKNNKFNILLSTKMLDEGYNLPSIDIGIILAAEGNKRQTIQRMGRVLRKKDKNSKLFQIYINDTFEAKISKERSEFFRKLCESYERVDVE